MTQHAPTGTNGSIDLQVNGYAGVDFNQDDVAIEQIRAACQRMQADGVAGFLGTIITAPADAMAGRIRRLADAWAQSCAGTVW